MANARSSLNVASAGVRKYWAPIMAMAFIAVALSSCAPVKEPGPPDATALRRVVTIVDDRGGYVVEFEAIAEWLAKTRSTVRIDGPCASSCLVFTYPKYDLKACATDKAWFGFHKPFAYRDGRVLTGDDFVVGAHATGLAMFNSLSPEMQKAAPYAKWPWVYNGNKPSDLIWIKGTTVMKEC